MSTHLHLHLPQSIAKMSIEQLQALGGVAKQQVGQRLRLISEQLRPADEPRDVSMHSTLPVLTWEEIAKHRTKESCWVVVDGTVYDVTKFLLSHPGGEHIILDTLAQSPSCNDTSEVFHAVHGAGILTKWGKPLQIGKTDGPAIGHVVESQHLPGQQHLPQLLPASLPSAFPHGRLEAHGLEAARFLWAEHDRLTETGSGEREDYRQRSKLGVLDAARDWVAVSSADIYASEMQQRHVLITSPETKDMVYGSVPAGGALEAERELLHMLLEWLPARYPGRFAVHRSPGNSEIAAVSTLTDGYNHRFLLVDYVDAPLRLVGLLTQEEWFLMREDEITASDSADNPSGKQHVFASGISVFAFDVHEKLGLPMAGIHSANVPGWQLHLQKTMNHVFTNMQPSISWWRHNWLLQDYPQILHPYFPWSPRMVAEKLPQYSELPHSPARWWESKDIGVSTAAEVGERLHLRVEYQTLRRLPRSRYIAFVRTMLILADVLFLICSLPPPPSLH